MLKIFKRKKQLILYFVFGLGTTAVNWIIYILLQLIFGVSRSYILTVYNLIAWFFAVTFAFFTNKIFVFKNKDFKLEAIILQAVKFFVSRIATGIFDVFLPAMIMYLGLSKAFLSIEGFWAKVISSIVVIILNYIFSKLIVFKNEN